MNCDEVKLVVTEYMTSRRKSYLCQTEMTMETGLAIVDHQFLSISRDKGSVSISYSTSTRGPTTSALL